MLGTVLLLISDVFMFLPPIGIATVENDSEITVTVYYSAVWIINNIGFSTTQISHLSMIPELADSDETRTSLTLIRNTMTAFANILAFVIAYMAFSYGMFKYDW